MVGTRAARLRYEFTSMFEATVEPPTPPRPGPQEIKYGDPTWVLENVPVSSMASRGTAPQAGMHRSEEFLGARPRKYTVQTEASQILPGPPRQQVVELREVSRGAEQGCDVTQKHDHRAVTAVPLSGLREEDREQSGDA